MQCKGLVNSCQSFTVRLCNRNVCAKFLQTQLNASKCLEIKAFADLYDCMELPKSSQTYIKNRFSEVVNYDEFLSLSSVEVIILISCNDIFVQLEEKVILMLYWYQKKASVIYWYDNIWYPVPTMSKCYSKGCRTVIKDQFVLAMGGFQFGSNCQFVEMLDVSSQSPCWIPMMGLLVNRKDFGVGTLDNCVYAIGGRDGENRLNSVEVFDINTNKWQMVTSMFTKRSHHGVGVLNNLLYAVGGYDGYKTLNSVECYNPCLGTWTPEAKMSEYRRKCGIRVMEGVLYAIGGENNSNCLKSVEAFKPSSGVWTKIADMHFCRKFFGVVVLNGLLHVIGGLNNEGVVLNSIEIYNRKTNTWSLKILSKHVGRVYSGVVVNRPPHFKTCDD